MFRFRDVGYMIPSIPVVLPGVCPSMVLVPEISLSSPVPLPVLVFVLVVGGPVKLCWNHLQEQQSPQTHSWARLTAHPAHLQDKRALTGQNHTPLPLSFQLALKEVDEWDLYENNFPRN